MIKPYRSRVDKKRHFKQKRLHLRLKKLANKYKYTSLLSRSPKERELSINERRIINESTVTDLVMGLMEYDCNGVTKLHFENTKLRDSSFKITNSSLYGSVKVDNKTLGGCHGL